MPIIIMGMNVPNTFMSLYQHVLGFGVIFCHSTIPPFQLLGLPSITHAHLAQLVFL